MGIRFSRGGFFAGKAREWKLGFMALTLAVRKKARPVRLIDLQRLALTVLALTTLCAGATDYFVNSSRPDDTGDGLGPATAKKTMQAAIAAAKNGDTLFVAAGTYGGTIHVSKSLTLSGAQAGVDARTRSVARSQESVLQSGGSNSATIVLVADGITLDGFTVLGDPTGTLSDIIGVEMNATVSGTRMRNNIVTQNTIGAYPAGNGLAQTVIQFNLFTNNNLPGSASGNGLYTDFGLKNALISANVIAGNSNGGVLITGVLPNNTNSGVLIQNNDISNCGVAVLLAFTSASAVDSNRIGGSQQGVQIRGANDEISITNNTITDSLQWPIVCFTRSDVEIDSRDITITGNTINQNVAVYQTLPSPFTTRAVIDVRNVQGQVTIAQNAVNMSGVLPAAISRSPGIEVQGATTGYVNIVLNELRGGNIDPAGTATPGAGVRIDVDLPDDSTIDVKFNKISGFSYGVDSLVGNSANPIHINYNDLAGTYAIFNEGVNPLDGLYNWYGQMSGPTSPSNPGGTGAAVSTNVLFSPWLDSGADLKPLDTSSQAAFLASVGLQTTGSPMVIISEATATPNEANPGQIIQFAAAGADPQNRPITVAWDFGDGTSGSGAFTTHAYGAIGTYTATATLSTPNGGVARTSASVSLVPPGGAATPPPAPQPFSVIRKSLRAANPSKGRDLLQVQGTFDLPAGTTKLDSTFVVTIGSVGATYLVNAKGRGVGVIGAGNALAILVKLKKGVIQETAAKFVLRVRGNFENVLIASGLAPGTSGPATISLQFTYLNTTYGEPITFIMSSRHNGSTGK